MSNPLISVITVCYNSEKTIERTIQSVLTQSYTNYEYIIIDGNSTDATLDIINKYSELFGEQLRIISENDEGLYDAMNKGINLSKGEIIGIVNSDDYYEKNTLEIVAKAFDIKNGIYQLLYGFTRIVRDDTWYRIAISNHEYMLEQIISHPACFVTKQLYDYLGGYDLNYKIAADQDFFYRVFYENINKKNIYFQPIYSVLSNYTSNGISSRGLPQMDLETLKIRNKWGGIKRRAFYKALIILHLKCFKYNIKKIIIRRK